MLNAPVHCRNQDGVRRKLEKHLKHGLAMLMGLDRRPSFGGFFDELLIGLSQLPRPLADLLLEFFLSFTQACLG